MVKVLHVNEFFYPFISGPNKRIMDMVNHTFRRKDHSVISFDKCNKYCENDCYEDIIVKRFEQVTYEHIHEMIHFGSDTCSPITKFSNYVRKENPMCLSLYWVEKIPLITFYAIPEARVVYTPFTYNINEFDPFFCNHFIKILLFSNESKASFFSAGIKKEQIYLADKPIDINYFSPLNIKRDLYRLLYVGRVYPSK